MIAHLSGMLVEASPSQVTIDVHGIGYEVLIPSSSFSNLPALGKQIRLFTQLVIRDNSHLLFGFSTSDERSIFCLLINAVSGIGPKIALNVLSSMSPSDFAIAVSEGNTGRLSQVSGLGKKTAGRIINELKDKLQMSAFSSDSSSNSALTDDVRDAISALITLGYKPSEASRRVEVARKMLGEKGGIDDLIKASLSISQDTMHHKIHKKH